MRHLGWVDIYEIHHLGWVDIYEIRHLGGSTFMKFDIFESPFMKSSFLVFFILSCFRIGDITYAYSKKVQCTYNYSVCVVLPCISFKNMNTYIYRTDFF